ncbi:penicillin-binding protein [Longispora fulva]|uniref:Membrane peptidoglycan carboxypeptidase n=1 Tax=Longispora fulva TaxID=619741 RepID=A0A8J7GI55_9ACTN|nr:transglycosylase domain-containing protein [Longispora fulva]MBG6139659.1 membrane peptidoglycan carboxypeptidase [Longispora fulva]GIG57959.1 penicillin-binding protein [Longispora fulva]
MSDYPPERPTGRASVPGLTPASPHDQPAHGGYDGPAGGYREPESGYREHGSGYDEPYQAPVSGRATVGRASVGAPPPPPAPGVAGRASVAGAAPVGLDEVAAVRGKGPVDPKKRKKRKRRNRIVALIAVVLMLTGLAFIGGTYYFTSVPLPNELPLNQISKVYASDGTTLIDTIGEENRSIVAFDKISKPMKQAMVAAEDRSFYQNSGVDFKGMVRALWNNLMGGSQQGASTITQQYARLAADLNQDSSYMRKAKEAVIAMKLDKEYTKDEILNFYLNTVDFGRTASGVQAAAQAYFGVDADKLTYEQAAVIALMVKSPGGFFEPTEKLKPTDKWNQNTVDRWGYVMDSLVATGAITKEQRDAAKFPDVKPLPQKGETELGKRPVAQVVKYVIEEMAARKIPYSELERGGYSIVTSIDPRLQAEAVNAASKTDKGWPMAGQDPKVQPALVATDPKTGRVLAYYGGPDGVGSDFAGYKKDSKTGKITGYGFHPPGSTAKVYVLAAALEKGYSVSSVWDGSSPKEFPTSGRVKGSAAGPVTNSDGHGSCNDHCTLRQATVESLNTPFFALTEALQPETVVGMMRKTGVQYMRPDGTFEATDITAGQLNSFGDKFNAQVGIGQYPITVLQQSAGFATFANDGVAMKQHFIVKATQRVNSGGSVTEKLVFDDKGNQGTRVMEASLVHALDDVLKDIHAYDPKWKAGLDGGKRMAAAKTGTWQFSDSNNVGNAHASIAGYTPQLATAVWVGSNDKEFALKVKNSNGSVVGDMYGGNLPGSIWATFMENAHKVMDWKPVAFPKATPVGNPELLGNGKTAPPTPPATGASGSPCPWGPIFCGGGGGGTPGGGAPSPHANDAAVPPTNTIPAGRRGR